MTDFATGLAFFLIIEGLLYVAAPSFVKSLAQLLPLIPEQQLRLGGLAAICLGVLMVWLLRG